MQVDGSSPLDRLVLGCFSHPEVARTGSELAAWRRDQPGPRVQRCVWGGGLLTYRWYIIILVLSVNRMFLLLPIWGPVYPL